MIEVRSYFLMKTALPHKSIKIVTENQGMKRRLFPNAGASGSLVVSLTSCVVGLAMLINTSALAAAAGPVPGSDESPAVLRETVFELSNPSGPDRLPELKSRAAGAITNRQNRLVGLTKALSNGQSKKADCSQAAVLPLLTAEATALNALGQKLAGETDIKRGKDSFRRIFTESRVYGLHSPRAFLIAQCLSLQVRGQKAAARLAEANTLEPTEATRLAGVIGQIVTDSRTAMNPLVALVPDRGDKALQASNIVALTTASDALTALDVSLTDVEAALDAHSGGGGGAGKPGIKKSDKAGDTKSSDPKQAAPSTTVAP
jgi:hypothetical protein